MVAPRFLEDMKKAEKAGQISNNAGMNARKRLINILSVSIVVLFFSELETYFQIVFNNPDIWNFNRFHTF